jgi:hypothetical protein
MKKIIFILIFITNTYAYFCPVGCLDGSTQGIYIQIGEKNYDINDQMMLQAFLELAKKMTSYYQNFENKSSELIEDGAKVQYLEDVLSAKEIFELKKINSLKSIEIDSNITKTNQNIKSNIK